MNLIAQVSTSISNFPYSLFVTYEKHYISFHITIITIIGVNDIPEVYGDAGNLLKSTSAVFNIGMLKLYNALQFFNALSGNHDAILGNI